jgi:hypothetical protein
VVDEVEEREKQYGEAAWRVVLGEEREVVEQTKRENSEN